MRHEKKEMMGIAMEIVERKFKRRRPFGNSRIKSSSWHGVGGC